MASSNTFLISSDGSGYGILIDPGSEVLLVADFLRETSISRVDILITHGHFDHAGSAAYFQKKYGCQVFMHAADLRTLKASNFLLMALKIPLKIEQPQVTYINDQFSIDINGHPLNYLHSPGHTPGSCVVELGSAWFTGDTIYSRGVGLSQLPGENVELLKTSILGLWGRLTSELTVYPGHGNAADGASVRCENRALLRFLGLIEIDSVAP